MIFAVLVMILASLPAAAQEILEPRPGSVIASPVSVSVRCGDPCSNGHAHMHVLIDTPAPEDGRAIPFDAHHLHVHKAQQKLKIDLPPGPHTVMLVLGSSSHNATDAAHNVGPVAFTVK